MKAKLEKLISYLLAEAGKHQGAKLGSTFSLLAQAKHIRAKMEGRA